MIYQSQFLVTWLTLLILILADDLNSNQTRQRYIQRRHMSVLLLVYETATQHQDKKTLTHTQYYIYSIVSYTIYSCYKLMPVYKHQLNKPNKSISTASPTNKNELMS